MPIWDSKVLDRIGIKSSNKRGQQKLEETIELYDVIVQWYSDLKANKASYNEYITSFDSRFPDYSSISDIKKIDFILWAMGEEEEDTIADRVGAYYHNKLSVEQRHMVSSCLDQITELGKCGSSSVYTISISCYD